MCIVPSDINKLFHHIPYKANMFRCSMPANVKQVGLWLSLYRHVADAIFCSLISCVRSAKAPLQHLELLARS